MNPRPRTQDGVYLDDLEEDEKREPEPDEIMVPGDGRPTSNHIVIKRGWCPTCKCRLTECVCDQEPEELDFA